MPKVLGGYIRSSAGADLSLQVVLGAARNLEEIRRLVLHNQLNDHEVIFSPEKKNQSFFVVFVPIQYISQRECYSPSKYQNF